MTYYLIDGIILSDKDVDRAYTDECRECALYGQEEPSREHFMRFFKGNECTATGEPIEPTTGTGRLFKVKEWFFDKVNDACKNYGMVLSGESTNGMCDHTILRVDEILAETDNAFKVKLEAETFSGHYKPWITWVPKGVIEDM